MEFRRYRDQSALDEAIARLPKLRAEIARLQPEYDALLRKRDAVYARTKSKAGDYKHLDEQLHEKAWELMPLKTQVALILADIPRRKAALAAIEHKAVGAVIDRLI